MNGKVQIMWPPLTKGVKILLILYAVVFVVHPMFSGSLGIREFIISTFYLSNKGMFSDFFLWQPLTYQLLHHDFFHLLFNSAVLYFFGGEVERRVGFRPFLQFAIGCGLGAALIGIVWHFIVPAVLGQPGLSATPIVGASGAISGIVAAYCLFQWNVKMRLLFAIEISGKHLLPIFIALDLLQLAMGSNISMIHHIGGMISGLLVTIIVWKPLQLIARFKLWRLKRKLKVMRGGSPTLPPDPDQKGSGKKNGITYH